MTWIEKAAQQIKESLEIDLKPGPDDGYRVASDFEVTTPERIASIISAHAAPLVALLREARRSHDRSYNEKSCDYPETEPFNVKCTCGADAWNARIDAVLAGSNP